jgi:hypothetical protein
MGNLVIFAIMPKRLPISTVCVVKARTFAAVKDELAYNSTSQH